MGSSCARECVYPHMLITLTVLHNEVTLHVLCDVCLLFLMGLWSFLLFFLFLVLLLCLGSLTGSILSGEPITFLEDLLCCALFSHGSNIPWFAP